MFESVITLILDVLDEQHELTNSAVAAFQKVRVVRVEFQKALEKLEECMSSYGKISTAASSYSPTVEDRRRRR